jgi:hypothetical protein
MRRGISSSQLGGGIEKTLMWRPSQRRQSCGVCRAAIGHLVDNQKMRRPCYGADVDLHYLAGHWGISIGGAGVWR